MVGMSVMRGWVVLFLFMSGGAWGANPTYITRPKPLEALLRFDVNTSQIPNVTPSVPGMTTYTTILINNLYKRGELNEVNINHLIRICYSLTAVYRSLPQEAATQRLKNQISTAVKQIVYELNRRFQLKQLTPETIDPKVLAMTSLSPKPLPNTVVSQIPQRLEMQGNNLEESQIPPLSRQKLLEQNADKFVKAKAPQWHEKGRYKKQRVRGDQEDVTVRSDLFEDTFGTDVPVPPRPPEGTNSLSKIQFMGQPLSSRGPAADEEWEDEGGPVVKPKVSNDEKFLERNRAAIKIQRAFRKWMARKSFADLINRRVERTRKRNAAYLQELRGLERGLAVSMKQKSESQEEMKRLQSQLSEQAEQSTFKQKKIDELTTQLATLAMQKTIAAEVKEVQVQVDLGTAVSSQLETAQKTIHTLEETGKVLRSELASVREQLGRATDEETAAKDKTNELEKQIQEVKVSLQEKTGEVAELTSLNNKLQESLNEQKVKIVQVDLQMQKLNKIVREQAPKIKASMEREAKLERFKKSNGQSPTTKRFIEREKRLKELDQQVQQQLSQIEKITRQSAQDQILIEKMTEQNRDLLRSQGDEYNRAEALLAQNQEGSNKKLDELKQDTETRLSELETLLGDVKQTIAQFRAQIENGGNNEQVANATILAFAQIIEHANKFEKPLEEQDS